MMKRFKVGIIGFGRIGRAAAFYFKKSRLVETVRFIHADNEAKYVDLLVGALPGEIGARCLALALKYHKNLVDLSDVDPPGYLKNESLIQRAGIIVIPGCGFSPGLTNFILGRELSRLNRVKTVEIKAGSLSKKKNYYPFLWCFEDIVVEHTIPSYQLEGGAKKRRAVFSGYREEKFFGIKAESYLCASGFENILDKAGVKNCFCRVVRPAGFMNFFQFLESYGLLDKNTMAQTKAMLERAQENNYTFAEISFITRSGTVNWGMRTFSESSERLNSMQKMTASVPAVVGEMICTGLINQKGLLFMEELAKDARIFNTLISGVKQKGIVLRRTSS